MSYHYDKCKNCGGDYELHRVKNDQCPFDTTGGGTVNKWRETYYEPAPKPCRNCAEAITAANEISHTAAAEIARLTEDLRGYERDNQTLYATNEQAINDIFAIGKRNEELALMVETLRIQEEHALARAMQAEELYERTRRQMSALQLELAAKL